MSTSRATAGEPVGPGAPAPRDGRAGLLLPGVVVLAIAVALGQFDGGYGRTVWHTAGLFVLALLVLVLTVAAPARPDRSRTFALAVGAFAAFTAWSFLSILWADVPGDAWEGANRTLLYLLGLVLVGLRPWPAWAGRGVLGLVAFGVGLAGAGLLVATAVDDDPTGLLLEGRLSEPFGYANATASFWLIAVWPALHLAIDRNVRVPVRVLALGVAALLLQLAVLSQSRGSAGAAVVAAVAFVLLHPRHWAALAAVGAGALVLLLGWDDLTAVRNADAAAQGLPALDTARATAALGVLAALALGLAGAVADRLVERRLSASRERRSAAARAFYGLAAVVALAGVALLASSGGWLSDRWEEFKVTEPPATTGATTRFGGGLGSGRHDFYRVALAQFTDHPVTGIGAENFAVAYLQDRRTAEAPRYPHSLLLSVLAMLGAVGTALLAAALALLGVLVARNRRRGSAAEAGVVAAAATAFLAWFAHAQVDWLWEYPALTLLALGLLVVAARTGDDPRAGLTSPSRAAPLALPARALLAVVAVVAAASLALPGAAARYQRAATQPGTPAQVALDRLERASRLDPLSADALLTRSLLARRDGRPDLARADVREALRREARNWFAWFELALLDGQERRWGPARDAMAKAMALNPAQPLLADARRRIDGRRPIDPLVYERELAGQLSARLQPFGGE